MQTNYARKIAIFLPVLAVSGLFLGTFYFHEYEKATPRRLLALIGAILLFYAWIIMDIRRRRQLNFVDFLIQSSFYVYLFGVLTLTGYFILFNQVSAHNWWHKMLERVYRREGVNLKPLLFLKGRHLLTYEVVGNFIMLLPLGIYLPLLYKKLHGFFRVTFVAMMVSVAIELMQLATSVRVTDIDDVILNTAGASVGFTLYAILYYLVLKPLQRSRNTKLYS